MFIKLHNVYMFPHKYVSLSISIYLTLRWNTAVPKKTCLIKKNPQNDTQQWHQCPWKYFFLYTKIMLNIKFKFFISFSFSPSLYLPINWWGLKTCIIWSVTNACVSMIMGLRSEERLIYEYKVSIPIFTLNISIRKIPEMLWMKNAYQ